jgi:DNA (cytosine-5)-methyltransferase 1
MLLPQDGRGRTRPVREPVPTVMTRGAIALAEGFLVPQHSERPARGKTGGQRPRARSVKKPLPTVTSHGAGALVRPFLVKYYRTGGAKSAEEPLDTVTVRTRFGLVEPGVLRQEKTGELFQLDIRFRMLKSHELAAAHGLGDLVNAAPPGISQEALVKMIGNSVPFETAKALCREALR